jgi:lysophospholipase L1-like esterase
VGALRRFVFAITACLLAVAATLALAEIALRIIYRDGGTTTAAGPGGGPFEYTFNGGERILRGPEPPKGPKRQGITRIVVQGDSVTWGQGVRNWYDLYPERLLERLNAEAERYEVVVFALPGREITSHVAGLQSYPDTLAPDVLVYQWYVNDIEIEKQHRPDPMAAPWRGWSGHTWARTHSYLYFFLDDRLRLLVPGGERSYPDYMAREYAPGTRGWELFRAQFSEWARLAKARSPRAIVMLYPTLLANGGDPMPRLREQTAQLARDLGLEVLDLTPHLQGFNTHASLFDSHPNEDAHAAIADALYEQIVRHR